MYKIGKNKCKLEKMQNQYYSFVLASLLIILLLQELVPMDYFVKMFLNHSL